MQCWLLMECDVNRNWSRMTLMAAVSTYVCQVKLYGSRPMYHCYWMGTARLMEVIVTLVRWSGAFRFRFDILFPSETSPRVDRLELCNEC